MKWNFYDDAKPVMNHSIAIQSKNQSTDPNQTLSWLQLRFVIRNNEMDVMIIVGFKRLSKSEFFAIVLQRCMSVMIIFFDNTFLKG